MYNDFLMFVHTTKLYMFKHGHEWIYFLVYKVCTISYVVYTIIMLVMDKDSLISSVKQKAPSLFKTLVSTKNVYCP